jgi:hypothetical protein
MEQITIMNISLIGTYSKVFLEKNSTSSTWPVSYLGEYLVDQEAGLHSVHSRLIPK